MTVDPVCGMTVEPAKAAGTFEHAGVKYFFCSTHCLARFKAEPAKYLTRPAPAEAATAISAPAADAYTCPMHPEIRSPKPGSCPKCGMALVAAAGGAEDDSELRDMTRRFWVSAMLSAPLVFIAMAPYFGVATPLGLAPHVRMFVEFVLGTPVVLWGGWPFFVKFARSLGSRNPNMYTLIGLGVALAYLFSIAAVFAPGLFPQEFREEGGGVGTYFEAAAIIVTLVLLGEVLQLRALGETSQAIRQLLGLCASGGMTR